MRDYKRLTIRNDDGTWGVNYLELANEVAKWQEQHATQYLSTDLTNILGEKLAEIEDRLENGTLVELPTTDKDILENYAHKIFDSWNDITGAVNKNCSWYYEALWVIDDIVGMVWGITSRQYEAKLRELKEKDNE